MICLMLFVMHRSAVTNVERGEMSLYEVPRWLFLFGFGMGIMLV